MCLYVSQRIDALQARTLLSSLFQNLLYFSWPEFPMLHFLHNGRRLWPPQQALDVAQASAKAHAAHTRPTAKALRTLDKLVGVLGALAVEGAPLAGATAHVTGCHAHADALTAAGHIVWVGGVEHTGESLDNRMRAYLVPRRCYST